LVLILVVLLILIAVLILSAVLILVLIVLLILLALSVILILVILLVLHNKSSFQLAYTITVKCAEFWVSTVYCPIDKIDCPMCGSVIIYPFKKICGFQR